LGIQLSELVWKQLFAGIFILMNDGWKVNGYAKRLNLLSTLEYIDELK
jgi:hypothetical protein